MSGLLGAFVGGGVNPFTLNVTNLARPNVQALASAQGWLGAVQPLIIVSTGLVSTLEIPASMNGCDILLDLSAASFVGGEYSSGTALKTRAHIKVRNLGTLAGGGGRGGNGGQTNVQFRSPDYIPDISWGYAGAGGAGQGFAASSISIHAAESGAAGTSSGIAYGYSAGGGPVGGGGRPHGQACGGKGGTGGGWGTAGSGGGVSSTSVSAPAGTSYLDGGASFGDPGGAAGLAVDGNSFITWISTGTRLGGIT